MHIPHLWCRPIGGTRWHALRLGANAFACGYQWIGDLLQVAPLPGGERCLGCTRALLGADQVDRMRTLNGMLSGRK